MVTARSRYKIKAINANSTSTAPLRRRRRPLPLGRPGSMGATARNSAGKRMSQSLTQDRRNEQAQRNRRPIGQLALAARPGDETQDATGQGNPEECEE